MNFTPLIYALWYSLIALECIATAACLARRLYSDYPCFVVYISFYLLRSMALCAIVSFNASYAAYFYTFWIGQIFEDGFLIAVLLELAGYLFAPCNSKLWSVAKVSLWLTPDDLKYCFNRCLLCLVIFSLSLPLLSRSVFWKFSCEWYVMAFARTATRTIDLIAFGSILLGYTLAFYLSVPWRRKASYLSAGIFLQYAVQTWFWFAVHSSNSAQLAAMQWIQLSGTIVACILWALAAFVPERALIELDKEQLESLGVYSVRLGERSNYIRERALTHGSRES